MKKQFISLTYHFTLGHDSVLIMLSFEVEMQTCQDRKRRDKMTEQTAHSGGSVILRLPFPAITHQGCGIATPARPSTTEWLFMCFQNTYWVMKHFPSSRKRHLQKC